MVAVFLLRNFHVKIGKAQYYTEPITAYYMTFHSRKKGRKKRKHILYFHFTPFLKIVIFIFPYFI